jgi:hypothetical protein
MKWNITQASATFGRLIFSVYCEVFKVVEEVALQRPCFAIVRVRATGMLAWIRPDPAELELELGGIAVFIGRGCWIVVVC